MAKISTDTEHLMSLPPPPTQHLPLTPQWLTSKTCQYLASDTESSNKHKYMHRKQKRHHHTTVSGVTMEARRVLELMLNRGVSQSDAPPIQSDSSGGVDLPRFRYYPSCNRPPVTDHEMKEKMDISLSEGPDESDYVYPHDISWLKKLPTLKSGQELVTAAISPRTEDVPQPSPQHSKKQVSFESLHLAYHCHPHHHAHHHSYHHNIEEELSSSSTEDYEYTDPNEFLRRKKKSFFRRATERLMHSFRRRKDHPLDLPGLEDSPREYPSSPTAGHPHGCKKKKGKMAAQFHHYSEKGGEDLLSRSVPGSRPKELWLQINDELLQVVHPPRDSLGLASPTDGATHYTDIEQYHEESLRRSMRRKVKDTGHLSDSGSQRGLWDHLLRQLKKKGSFRIKKKGAKGGDSFRSAESLPSSKLTSDQGAGDTGLRAAGLQRGVKPETFSLQEAMSRRLDQQMGVATPPPLPLSHPGSEMRAPRAVEEPDYDEIEEASMTSVMATLDVVDGFFPRIPFDQRTTEEKDELYEKIAEQLAAIADNYNTTSVFNRTSAQGPSLGSALMESSGSSELEGAAAPRHPPDVLYTSESSKSKSGSEEDKRHRRHLPTETEQNLGELLRKDGDYADVNPADVTPLVEDLLRTSTYSKFQEIVSDNIGTQPGWQQIAMVFRLTQTAVQMAGLGTSAALHVKEMTMKYFEDRFASWIVRQGGWESVVEDTEQDSELD